MRWIIGIVVVAVLAGLGYEYFRPDSRPPVAGGVVQPAEPDRTPADRTQAVAEQVAKKSQQVAADAARRMQATADRVASAAQDVANSGGALAVGETDLGQGLTDAVDGVTDTLGGVTDQASAQAAVPTLVEIDARLDQLKSKVEQLPDAARNTLASLVTGMLPKVQSAVARVQATEGAGEVLDQALDPIMAKLDDWSRRPA